MDVKVPKFRTAWNYDRDAASLESALVCADESLAVQSEAAEADINTIVRRFGLTGQLPQGVRPPMFGDFTQVMDYRSALDAVIAADEAFMEMPADVRKRFHDDPQEFVAFCSDEKNLEEMRKLGLAIPAPVEDNRVQKVEIVSPAQPAAAPAPAGAVGS